MLPVQSLSPDDLHTVDFKPVFPTFLFHSRDDNIIPHTLSDSLCIELRRAGGKVCYRKTRGPHLNTGFKIEMALIGHILLLSPNLPD